MYKLYKWLNNIRLYGKQNIYTHKLPKGLSKQKNWHENGKEASFSENYEKTMNFES